MTIYEQLENYCDCIQVNTEDVDELVNLVSMATCWALSPCETFLSERRQEVIKLPLCLDNCEVITFEPYFTPFKPESMKMHLVEVNGIKERKYPVKDFAYSETTNSFRIDPNLPTCKCKPVCGCEKEYYLVAEYIAGYDEIPECLLPAFCEALQYVVDRRKCECECQECNYDDKTEVLVYNAASITNQLKVYFVEMLSEQYKRQLSMISLCDQHLSIWGYVA